MQCCPVLCSEASIPHCDAIHKQHSPLLSGRRFAWGWPVGDTSRAFSGNAVPAGLYWPSLLCCCAMSGCQPHRHIAISMQTPFFCSGAVCVLPPVHHHLHAFAGVQQEVVCWSPCDQSLDLLFERCLVATGDKGSDHCVIGEYLSINHVKFKLLFDSSWIMVM